MAAATFRLGYVEFATPDLDAAVAYYAKELGGTVTARDADAAFVSLGLDHHNIALRRAGQPALNCIGLQAVSGTLDALEWRLRDAGIEVLASSDARPGVPRLLTVSVGGHVFELFEEMATPASGFAAAGIIPNKAGHAALLTPDAGAVIAFLTEGLGFTITDWFEDAVTFLTCNRDHHVINVIAAPVVKLHHLAFELHDAAHHVAAADRLARNGRPTVWGPSRHTAGHNLAAYHYGPDRTLIELYAEMDVFVAELGYCEPRPWHEQLPQRPRKWPLTEMTTWGTPYEFDFRTA